MLNCTFHLEYFYFKTGNIFKMKNLSKYIGKIFDGGREFLITFMRTGVFVFVADVSQPPRRLYSTW